MYKHRSNEAQGIMVHPASESDGNTFEDDTHDVETKHEDMPVCARHAGRD